MKRIIFAVEVVEVRDLPWKRKSASATKTNHEKCQRETSPLSITMNMFQTKAEVELREVNEGASQLVLIGA